jgi:hypothetical protein
MVGNTSELQKENTPQCDPPSSKNFGTKKRSSFFLQKHTSINNPKPVVYGSYQGNE